MKATPSCIRTIRGDVAVEELGRCSAHEHVIIESPHIAAHHAAFVLDDVDAACTDLGAFREAGGSWVVDTMPVAAGRHAFKLAEASRRSGVQIVAPTGLHLPTYYPPDASVLSMDREELAALFEREIVEGLIDGPGRAGVIKVAGDLERLSDHQREAFAAAGHTFHRTGCPIITHTERGTAGMEQVKRLVDAGADPARVVLSHTDRLPDVAYHRELLETGVTLEYDQHFRWLARGEDCPTLDLIAELLPVYPNQIVVGMDLARRAYWRGHGGGPGLAWLLTDLPSLLRDRGLHEEALRRVLRENPARAFAFGSRAQTVGV